MATISYRSTSLFFISFLTVSFLVYLALIKHSKLSHGALQSLRDSASQWRPLSKVSRNGLQVRRPAVGRPKSSTSFNWTTELGLLSVKWTHTLQPTSSVAVHLTTVKHNQDEGRPASSAASASHLNTTTIAATTRATTAPSSFQQPVGVTGGAHNRYGEELQPVAKVWAAEGAVWSWPATLKSCRTPGKVQVCTKPRKKFIIFRATTEETFMMRRAPGDFYQFGCCDGIAMGYTTNRSLYDIADIVEVGARSYPNPYPRKAREDQVFMLLSGESGCTTASQATFDKMNLLRMFTRESEIPFSFSDPLRCSCEEYLKPLKVPFEKREKALVSAVISNCATHAGREHILRLMMSKLEVHSMGGCYHNHAGLAGGETMNDRISKYLYNYAAENTVCEDYITEKFGRTLVAGTVPLVVSYKQYPGYERVAPNKHSYVDLSTFPTLIKAFEFIKEVSKSKTKYLQHHTFREQTSNSTRLTPHFKKHFCGKTEADHLEDWCKVVRRMQDKEERLKMARNYKRDYTRTVGQRCAKAGIMHEMEQRGTA